MTVAATQADFFGFHNTFRILCSRNERDSYIAATTATRLKLSPQLPRLCSGCAVASSLERPGPENLTMLCRRLARSRVSDRPSVEPLLVQRGRANGPAHGRSATSWPAAALVCAAVWSSSCAAATSDSRADQGALHFDVKQGLNLNRFVRQGPVAAHLVLRSGRDPRITESRLTPRSGRQVWPRRALCYRRSGSCGGCRILQACQGPCSSIPRWTEQR